LPHEDRYNKPTIENRNASVIMKSGVFDGATGSHKLMDQSFTREDLRHAWYDEPQALHPFDRTTKPIQKNTIDHNGKYSWASAVMHSQDGR
ncbi:nickel-dependent hydrogenase large subunit, partial [Acinetobacter baumannii]